MEAMDPLDRKAAALHLAKVAYHVSALAKLFDPSVKASKVKGGVSHDAEGGAAAGKPPRPKREPTPYTLYIKEQMPAFKEQLFFILQHPEMQQKDRFRALAAQWQQDPTNPKAGQKHAAELAAGLAAAAGGAAEGETKKKKKHKHRDEEAGVDGDGEKKHKKKHKHRDEEE